LTQIIIFVLHKIQQLFLYMRTISLIIALSIPLIFGCRSDSKKVTHFELDPYSYELGVIGGFSELINAGVKQLALSAPLVPEEMDRFMVDAEKIASKFNISIYRESDLIVTDLFPDDVALGKDVLLLYKGTTLEQYLSLKADRLKYTKDGSYDNKARREIARRFGRMLSYGPREINSLLSQNSAFRTMDDFGIRANHLFLYYKDLEKAGEFYSKILGMELVADYDMALILRMTTDSYLILVDAARGMHTSEEPKSVALALLTDQLEDWYDYLNSQQVTMKYEYQPKEGSAHDGFVAIDPEGYLLEFERFNQHPENEKFIPILDRNKETAILLNQDKRLPQNLSLHSTITWLYYKDLLAMQNFYQDVIGLEVVADQGWTKIFKVSDTGFLGIVDEKRGMHSFSEKKAVNVGFIIDSIGPWFEYAKGNRLFDLYEENLGVDAEARYKSFVGFCPEGYFLEFDCFYPHDENNTLLSYLNK